jgi:hypothetical protein
MKCPNCDEEHEWWEMEIGFEVPDPYLKLSREERSARCQINPDICVIDGDRFFVRGVLQIPIRETERSFGWGVWAELSPKCYQQYLKLEQIPELPQERIACQLASEVPSYADSLGLKLNLWVLGSTQRPLFYVQDVEHAMGKDQQQGVSEIRVLTWLQPYLHANQ